MGNDKQKTTQQNNAHENEKKGPSTSPPKPPTGTQSGTPDPRQKAGNADSGGNADAVEGDATSKR